MSAPLCAKSDRTQRSKNSILNHLVGVGEQRRQHLERDSPKGIYGISVGISGSLRLDASGLDHLTPLLGFIGKELAEFRGRHRQRHGAEVGQSSLYPWIRKRSVDLSVELIDDFRRNVLGRAESTTNVAS